MADAAGGLWGRLLVEPARPDAIRGRRGAEWLVVATVCIGAFMGQLDASIVTLTLPTLRHAFGASLVSVEWVALAYLVVLVGAVTAVGRLGDVVGRKLLYTYGFAVFTLATIGCGLAPDLGVLIACRVLQALGAAMLQANSVALIVTSLPVERRASGLGIQGAAQALGLALGPTVGGLLISAGGWRWVFFATVPAGVIGTVAGWYLLPRSRERAEPDRFDWPGLTVFAPTVFAVLVVLTYSRQLSPPLVAGLLVLAVVGAAAVVAVERRAAAPLLPPALFSQRAFSTSVAAGLLSYLTLFGLLFAVPFYCEDSLHVSTAVTGLLLTTLPAALGLTAPFAGAAADRWGGHWLAISGMALCSAAFVVAATTSPGLPVLAAVLVLAGVGFGLFTPSNNAHLMAVAPARQSGQVGGVLNMTRGLGTALGVAVTGLAFASDAGNAGHGFRTASWLLAALACTAAAVVGWGAVSRVTLRQVARR
jgi:EmrB/QacA subfamily drug resistance transporter